MKVNKLFTTDKKDIIDMVTSAFKKYECPRNIDCENKHIDFWIQVIKTGIAELESDISEENIKKELSDIVFIGIDSLNKMGYNTRKVLEERLYVNSKKDLSGRDKNFYLDKESQIKSRIGDNND